MFVLINKVDDHAVDFAPLILNDLRVHMVLKRQDDGEGRGLEGTLCYSLDHLLQKHKQRRKALDNITINYVEYTHLRENVVIII